MKGLCDMKGLCEGLAEKESPLASGVAAPRLAVCVRVRVRSCAFVCVRV